MDCAYTQVHRFQFQWHCLAVQKFLFLHYYNDTFSAGTVKFLCNLLCDQMWSDWLNGQYKGTELRKFAWSDGRAAPLYKFPYTRDNGYLTSDLVFSSLMLLLLPKNETQINGNYQIKAVWRILVTNLSWQYTPNF